jgi:hypothetical protein
MRPSAIHSEPAVHHLIFCEQKWLSPSQDGCAETKPMLLGFPPGLCCSAALDGDGDFN